MKTFTTSSVPVTTVRSLAPQGFGANPARGRFNSAFFSVMGGYLNWHMHQHKTQAYADLSPNVVELGPGVGANLRYLPSGARLIAIEPNPYMHTWLRRAARRRGVELEIRSVVGERIDLPDASAEAVISSLVLCTVSDPAAVLAEIRRILRRPWAWTFEGCSCERDLATAIRSAGFASVDLSHYRIHSPFVPFNTQIAGTAIA